MQIWRMHADGSSPEQMTFDENSNWFAHPSPDNKWIVYIAYTSDETQNHLFGKNVKLRLMDAKSKAVKDILLFFMVARVLSVYHHGALAVKKLPSLVIQLNNKLR